MRMSPVYCAQVVWPHMRAMAIKPAISADLAPLQEIARPRSPESLLPQDASGLRFFVLFAFIIFLIGLRFRVRLYACYWRVTSTRTMPLPSFSALIALP